MEFLLDNLGEPITLDHSVESLVKAEAVYWRYVNKGIPMTISDLDQFEHLLGQYLGQCVIHHTGAKWVQCMDSNMLFGQPCIEGFSDQKRERIYPVDTVTHLRELPKQKPYFPGVREQRVLAAKLEGAVKIYKNHSLVSGEPVGSFR